MGYYEILMESLEYLAKSGNVFSDFSRTCLLYTSDAADD